MVNDAKTTNVGSQKNILVVEDYLSKSICKDLSEAMARTTWRRCQSDSEAENYRSMQNMSFSSDDMEDDIVKIASYEFGVNLSVFAGKGNFHKWDVGDNLSLHTDAEKEDCTAPLASYIDMYQPPTVISYTALVYINDDYQGGELVFPQHGLKIKPKSGTLVMFPSTCMYPHEVAEVASGVRYTYSMFMASASVVQAFMEMYALVTLNEDRKNGK
jgi:predicted 2-oxoglutarate/Fe(II)-dependent dioxygenase YbiX